MGQVILLPSVSLPVQKGLVSVPVDLPAQVR
jgi:hypothetical protein